jgi:hypothetical protein
MLLDDLQRKAAEAFVAGTRKASPNLRSKAMGSPARSLITAQIFAGMARSYDRSKGADLDAVIRWEVGPQGAKPEIWDLVIREGRARTVRVTGDAGEQPRTTVGLDHETLLELATGILNAPQAYIAGRLRMKGDVMLAQRLTTLFTVPGARSPKPAQAASPRT